MAANEVVYFHSAETGAPTLNNAAGSLIAVLDACLITGFRPITLTSLSVSGGIATAVFNGHGFEADRLLDMAGAGISALNGRKRVLVSATNTYTFDATGVADTASVSGTITAKRSPIGWVKQYAGTNKAVYARSDVTVMPQVLRIDDTGTGSAGTTYARANAAESATDVDTLVGSMAASGSGQCWNKGANTATAKNWALVGDGKSFYLFADGDVITYGSTGGLTLQGFGDLIPNKSGDQYASFLIGADNSGTNYSITPYNSWTSSMTASTMLLSRSYSGLGANGVRCAVHALWSVSAANDLPVFPSVVDNGVEIEYPIRVRQSSVTFGNPYRGVLPGLGFMLGNVSGTLHKRKLDNLVGTSRSFRALTYATGSNASNNVGVVLDETGPWQ